LNVEVVQHLKKKLIVILTLMGFLAFGQENILDPTDTGINLRSSKELLIGKWVFVKAVDTLGNESRLPVLSKPMEVGMIMPDITIESDYTFKESLRIDPDNIYSGTWEINNNKIQYKRKTTLENPIEDLTTDIIIELTSKIMVVQNQKNCMWIYIKIKE
jgi:hypothetical protein